MRFLRPILIFTSILAGIGVILFGIYGNKYTPPRFESAAFAEQDLTNAMQKIADATVEGGAPGALIHVRKGGETFDVTAGLANKATTQPMRAELPLRVASISKIYTATVIHSLANQGVLNLDTTLNEILPQDVLSGVPNAKEATVRQLLYHTSGIPDYYDLRSYLFEDWREPISLERMLPHVRRMNATGAPGEKYTYSNTGFLYLGAVAEAVSGRPLKELITAFVIEPLELSSTFYNVRQTSDQDIHGYGTYLRPWKDATIYWEHSGPDSGIMASASDVALFLEALTFEGGELHANIGRPMLGSLIQRATRREQGLGIETIVTRSGEKMIGHTGSAFGYKTLAFALPHRDLVFVAHVNCECDTMVISMLRNIFVAIGATDKSYEQEASGSR